MEYNKKENKSVIKDINIAISALFPYLLTPIFVGLISYLSPILLQDKNHFIISLSIISITSTFIINRNIKQKPYSIVYELITSIGTGKTNKKSQKNDLTITRLCILILISSLSAITGVIHLESYKAATKNISVLLACMFTPVFHHLCFHLLEDGLDFSSYKRVSREFSEYIAKYKNHFEIKHGIVRTILTGIPAESILKLPSSQKKQHQNQHEVKLPQSAPDTSPDDPCTMSHKPHQTQGI
jgi:hypothetical protein